MVEQSTALTSLVAHLAAHTADGMSDLNLSSSSSQTSGTRGVLRREKMQSDLAARSGNFYLQLMQQMHRRLHPGKPVPQNLSELQSLSMLQYLERQGGFRHQRETGLVLWLMGHVVDAINAEDWAGVRELVALTVVSLEQSAIDWWQSLLFRCSRIGWFPCLHMAGRSRRCALPLGRQPHWPISKTWRP